MTESKPEEGLTSCQYRNKCWLGCPFDRFFSTESSTLPAALKTGNLTVWPFSTVTEILYDKDKKRATGVAIIDAQTNKTYEFTSKIIFVKVSPLKSAWLLMNSPTHVWDTGLGSSSGELGHNVMDNPF
ncbi:MAG: choline dehydrogenase-like flavoprotein [Paraglaciecola sp.]|jgi:choline dehydrogenase-like flavoprotein